MVLIISFGICACLIGWALCHPRMLLALILAGAIIGLLDNPGDGFVVCAGILFVVWLFEDSFLRWVTGGRDLPSLGWEYLFLGLCWVILVGVIYFPAAFVIVGIQESLHGQAERNALWPFLLAAVGSTIWLWREMQSLDGASVRQRRRTPKQRFARGTVKPLAFGLLAVALPMGCLIAAMTHSELYGTLTVFAFGMVAAGLSAPKPVRRPSRPRP
jgi:hypothetical protein